MGDGYKGMYNFCPYHHFGVKNVFLLSKMEKKKRFGGKYAR